MKHTYKIHGMTCNGCRNHVEGTLSKVKGVSKATVNLAKAEATIEMESHIPIEKFQDALKKKVVLILSTNLESDIIKTIPPELMLSVVEVRKQKMKNLKVKELALFTVRCIVRETKHMKKLETVLSAEWI